MPVRAWLLIASGACTSLCAAVLQLEAGGSASEPLAAAAALATVQAPDGVLAALEQREPTYSLPETTSTELPLVLASAPPAEASPARPRLPELAGLLLDPAADDERLRAAYAWARPEDLERARFRLERLLEVFQATPGDAPLPYLRAEDSGAVGRELEQVAKRLGELPRPAQVLDGLATSAADRPQDYEARYAFQDAEEVYLAAWRVQRAREASMELAFDELFARGEYALAVGPVGWG
jgi:hypothetical protein